MELSESLGPVAASVLLPNSTGEWQHVASIAETSTVKYLQKIQADFLLERSLSFHCLNFRICS